MRLGIISFFWLLAIGVGLGIIFNYENTSGAVGPTPEQWPANAQITLDPTLDTLIMFAHPRCPCTRASVDELNRIMARCEGRLTSYVLFIQPKGLPDTWVQTGMWHTASSIPGVTVQADSQGLIAQSFGAKTSGYVVLYDPRGRLLFNGGITVSRGHAGDNAGEDAIITLVNGQNPGLTQTLVYGCSLLNGFDTQHCLSNESTNSTKP
jgi:hypothetical protein